MATLCQVDPAARRRQEREWSEWYDWAVPAAEDLYENYLEELQEEGLI